MTDDEVLRSRANEPTREQIDACTDEPLLARWYLEHVERDEQIRAFVEGYQYTGVATADWLRRGGGKIGYTKMAARWIEKRMLTLGFVPPYSPEDPRANTIRAQRVTIERLRKALRQAGLQLPGEANVG